MAELRRIAPALAGLVGLAGLAAATLRAGEPNAAPLRAFVLTGLLWVAFAISCWLLLRAPIRAGVALLIAGGIALQAVAISAPPRTTDDFYRYAWDGRVQAAGVDPYRYAPTAPELSGLRDEWLFPGGVPRLNRPDQPTAYPPGAQAYFLTVHELSPAGSRHKPWQVAGALLAVATTVLLITALRGRGGDPRLAVLWAWCPTVFLEAGNNGHVDALAALLVVAGLAVLAGATRFQRWLAVGGGTLLGAATAVKLLPALVLAGLAPRRFGPALAAAAAVFGTFYLPHVMAVGGDVLGFLPGYLAQEGYDGSGRFALVRLLLPQSLAPYAAAAVLAVVVAISWRQTDPTRPWHGPLLVTAATFLLLTPSYPWYALLLVALVALDGRWEWLGVAAAGYVAYFAGPLGVTHVTMQVIGYGSALAVLAVRTTRASSAIRKTFSLALPNRGY